LTVHAARRIQLVEEDVQLRSVAEEATARVALQLRDARARIGQEDVERHGGSERQDGREA
jgi:hypothetical protein